MEQRMNGGREGGREGKGEEVGGKGGIKLCRFPLRKEDFFLFAFQPNVNCFKLTRFHTGFVRFNGCVRMFLGSNGSLGTLVCMYGI